MRKNKIVTIDIHGTFGDIHKILKSLYKNGYRYISISYPGIFIYRLRCSNNILKDFIPKYFEIRKYDDLFYLKRHYAENF